MESSELFSMLLTDTTGPEVSISKLAGKEWLLSIAKNSIFNAWEYRLLMDYNDPQKSLIHRDFERYLVL